MQTIYKLRYIGIYDVHVSLDVAYTKNKIWGNNHFKFSIKPHNIGEYNFKEHCNKVSLTLPISISFFQQRNNGRRC